MTKKPVSTLSTIIILLIIKKTPNTINSWIELKLGKIQVLTATIANKQKVKWVIINTIFKTTYFIIDILKVADYVSALINTS